MRVRIRMLGEENLYKQQDLKKGNSTSMGFKSLCFSCLIAPHLHRISVTESEMSWAHAVCCILPVHVAAIHTHTLAYVNCVLGK